MGALATPLPDQRRVVLAYLNVFFILIQQRLRIMALPGEATQRTFLPYSYQVQTTLSYMQRNMHRNIPLSELARVANMRHVSNFCVQFRREVGATPAAHHLALRLDAAREALLKPGSDITSLALAQGLIPTSISAPRSDVRSASVRCGGRRAARPPAQPRGRTWQPGRRGDLTKRGCSDHASKAVLRNNYECDSGLIVARIGRILTNCVN